MSNEIQPLLHMIKNIAIDALDDCTIIVRIATTAQNPKKEMNPCCEKEDKNSNTSGLLL